METHLSIMSQWIDIHFERDLFFTYSPIAYMLFFLIYHAGSGGTEETDIKTEENRNSLKRFICFLQHIFNMHTCNVQNTYHTTYIRTYVRM